MSPTLSRAALRVLISVLLASSIVDAAALRHEALDARTPLVQTEGVSNADEAAQAITALASVVPENLFDEISDQLNEKSAFQVLLDFIYRLFGPKEDSDDDADSTATTTVFITPTPVPVESIISAVEITPTPTFVYTETISSAVFATSLDVVVPPGPPTTSTDVSTDIIFSGSSSATPGPAASDVYSILPVGNMSTAINATFIIPVFSTAPETTPAPPPSSLPIVPPYPANSSSVSILPTAVSITGYFSVYIPLSTGVSSAVATVASSVSAGLSLPWAGNASYLAINPTLILTNPIRPTDVSNATAAPLNTTSTTVSLTSVTIVTQTILPFPVLITGTGAPVSAGTGAPIAISEAPLWSNSSLGYAAPTILPAKGTGVPISVGTAAGTAVGTVTGTAVGTGAPIVASESPFYPNSTTVIVTPIVGSIPIYVTQIPLTVTGAPGSIVNLTVSLPAAPYPNGTVSSAPTILPTGTAVYVAPVSEIPYLNTTTTLGETATEAPFATSSVSVGTIVSIPSYSAPPLYPNTTTAIITEILVSTGTAVLSLPPVATQTDAVEFPEPLSFRTLCANPQIRVISLPLLDRFFGPSAYPSLFSIPGCTAPNARQSLQAPGLLNCSALGDEVQACQALGKKVLLSVKGDGLASAGGNAEYGNPSAEGLGPVFERDSAGGMAEEKVRRQGVGKPWGIEVPTLKGNVRPTPKPIVLPTLKPISLPTLKPIALPTPIVDLLEGILGLSKSVKKPILVTTTSSIANAISTPVLAVTEVIDFVSSAASTIISTPSISTTLPFRTSSPLISTDFILPTTSGAVEAISSISWPLIFTDAIAPTTSELVEVTSSTSLPLITADIILPTTSESVEAISSISWPLIFTDIVAPTTSELVEVTSSTSLPLISTEIIVPITSETVEANSSSTTVVFPIELTPITIEPVGIPSQTPFIVGPPGIPMGPGPVIVQIPPETGPSFNETPATLTPPIIEETGPPYNVSMPVLNLTAPAPTSILTQTLIPPMTRPFPSSSTSTIQVSISDVPLIPFPISSPTPILEPITPFPISDPDVPNPEHPNLFDSTHPPSSFALTISSLFGSTQTERADLRPLGPDVLSDTILDDLQGLTDREASIGLARPLGEEVVVDGFDVQLPAEWRGTYQRDQFKDLVNRLKALEDESWKDSGEVEGGPNDLGAEGEGVVYFGWIGGALKVREVGGKEERERMGWVEWDGRVL